MRLTIVAALLAATAVSMAAIINYQGTPQGALCTATDGDSLRCGPQRIRLRGIDAPELSQPGGAAAHSALAKLVSGPIVCQDLGKDRYQRTLAKCSAKGEPDIGKALVRQGFAHSYYDYPQDEAAAKAERLGVWASPTPIKPQDWRRGRRNP